MTPEQEEQVRRALASAPPESAMPPEVAARLDAALAGLVAERSARPDHEQDTGPEPAAAVALEERRRRRWPRVLVAAASVSLLAYGAGIALEGVQLSGGSADTTAAREGAVAGDNGAAGGSDSAPEDAPTGLVTDSASGRKAHVPQQDGIDLLVPQTVRMHSETLAKQVSRLVEVEGAKPYQRDLAPTEARALSSFLAPCERPDTARGDRLAAVRLDGRPGTLVVRTAVDGTRVAEVYSCGDGTKLLAITQLPPVR